ncbi:/ / WhiA LAGLIDADG-like domain containing protein / 469644:470570 Reverse [Candidatus Hepatoplasma crinochetorum]|uniref:/ / WhiA LAGLIDADG-like domain containing protein / 469644:470570 Reverse n=1 Tax=Candidatus Hepatoplasma crinochetorum TaxID=295596 RepID=A0A0G7ZMZ8_9MOLU|nr:/ / WhiA LAGLIDADG-like domain containing protein / 469644:470570 Reverse [Candidatus Hepatoplasma crinochetorum]
MNFSKQIKNEILNLNWTKKEQQILFYISLSLLIQNKKDLFFTRKIKNEDLFKFIFTNLKKLNQKNYYIKFIKKDQKIFIDKNFFDDLKYKFLSIEEEILNNKNLYQITVAAIFLIKGSISNYDAKNNYLEIRLNKINNEEIYRIFCKINNKLSFKFNFSDKNNFFYLKKAIYISDFLKYIKTTDSLIDFEENRIIKEMNLNLKRAEVIEKFNKEKIINNSLKQIEAIKLVLKDQKKFNKLTEGQIKLAKLRLDYKDSSLEDLKYYFYLNYQKNISKSTVNNWLKKIKEIADNLN